MELYQLYYFKMVSETEHFTRAAEQLHISQPSLSKAISNLEAELGVQLFERDKRAVYLNDFGKAFLKHVNRILTETDEAAREIQDMLGQPGGDVYIGCCAVFSEPSQIHVFNSDFFLNHPKIGLHLYVMETNQIEELLLARKLDLGLSVTLPQHPEIESIELFSYQVGVVLSAKHPLAGRESIFLGELREENFMCNNTAPDLRDSVYTFCRLAGFEPKVVFEGESADLIGRAVARGRGVAFISADRHRWKQETHQDENGDEVVYIPIQDTFCQRTVYLFRPRNRYLPSAAQKYQEGLLDFIHGK